MRALIFGGGKIARGFIGQLLYRGGIHATFVDMNEKLLDALREAGKYYVNVMGNEKESEWIDGFDLLSLTDTEGIARALLEADVAFTAVGGKNLDSLGGVIARAYALADEQWPREKRITLITCENWKNPAPQLEKAMAGALEDDGLAQRLAERIGVSEAAILRSGIEPAPAVIQIDPNAVSVTDYWELPVDADRWNGVRVEIPGIRYMHQFGSFLQRKIYTFNTTNATIAFIGLLKGYTDLADAANDEQILDILHQVMAELNPAIEKLMNVDPQEQEAFALKAQRKYQDRSVIDYLERHARDPVRKLGPTDRIVGSARLIEQAGGEPRMLALTLAAALYYKSTNPADPSAQELENMRRTQGVDAVLESVCQIGRDEPLCAMVHEKIEFLKESGWINGE